MGVLRPPVGLALARDEREVPGPDARWAFEPKFDGWRAAAFTALGRLQSRRDNDLAARFPEIVRAVRRLGDLVVDGELVALREGRLDFGALTSSPKGRAAAGVAIYYVVFDLLADGELDLRGEPYRIRRAALEERFAEVEPPLQLVPATDDRTEAMRWMRPEAATIGIEGVVAKDATRPYRAGRTGDWRKIRQKIVVLFVGAVGVRTGGVRLGRARRAARGADPLGGGVDVGDAEVRVGRAGRAHEQARVGAPAMFAVNDTAMPCQKDNHTAIGVSGSNVVSRRGRPAHGFERHVFGLSGLIILGLDAVRRGRLAE